MLMRILHSELTGGNAEVSSAVLQQSSRSGNPPTRLLRYSTPVLTELFPYYLSQTMTDLGDNLCQSM